MLRLRGLIALGIALAVPFGLPARAAPPDLILFNGTVLTMENSPPVAEAVAISGDTLVAVGTNSQVLALAGPYTRAIDLQGLTVVPGFIDAHCHRLTDLGLLNYASPDEAIQDALTRGWTTLHELYITQDRLDNLHTLDLQGRLRLRVALYLALNAGFTHFPPWYTAYQPGQELSALLRIAGVKVTLDQEWGENIFFTRSELDQTVRAADSLGWQVATHAFALESMDRIVDSYEGVIGGGNNSLRRHRIEHCGLLSDSLLNRVIARGIIASVQFDGTPYMPDDSSFQQRVPPADRPLMVRTRDLLLGGARVMGSTDAPWGTTDWRYNVRPGQRGAAMWALYCAATRIGFWGRIPESWQVAQTIPVADALRLMTKEAAWSTFEEDRKGTLAAGKLADLVVLSDNPLTVPLAEVPAIRTVMTMVGGKAEYCAPGTEGIAGAFARNLALGRPASASAELPGYPSASAVDGDLATTWSAGSHPAQWIEIDLQEPSAIAEIQLAVSQFPDGDTEHRVWGKGPGPSDPYQLLHSFGQYTRAPDMLVYRPPIPWNGIRSLKVETVSGPSWVSWREIRVLGPAGPVTAATIPVTAGWNMVSLPVVVPDGRPAIVFPQAVSGAYRFTATGYEPADTLRNGSGYWMKFASTQSVTVGGAPWAGDTVGVQAGWNLIGAGSEPIDTAAIGEIPPGIVASAFYEFAGSYAPSDSLRPGRSYWVKAAVPGRLIVSPP